MVYLDLNESFPDIYQLSSAAPIPIIPNQNSYNQHPKEFEEYLINSNRISSYTEFLSTDNVMVEAYGGLITTQATTCSTPESDDYNIYVHDHDSKIKLEYDNSLDVYMSRTISSESCPELSCGGQPPLTPIDSPHDQSPIMPPSCLPMSHHQYQQPISDDILTSQVTITSPTSTTKRGRGRRAATTSSSSSTTISGMQQLQDPQNFQLVGSPSLPSPTQKTTGKSRGRRMTNKPAKPGTKSFECTYAGCGRVFKRSEHLKRHIRSIHTLERPFHCPHPHCTKRFSRSDNLSQHVRVHRPNGKEKNPTTRTFNNFTPFLATYQQPGNHLQSLQHH